MNERSEEKYAFPRENSHHIHIKFNHPGVLVSIGQLRYAKWQLQLGNEPWKSAFEAMANNSLAAMDYQVNAGTFKLLIIRINLATQIC
jgi:hypothetical protein